MNAASALPSLGCSGLVSFFHEPHTASLLCLLSDKQRCLQLVIERAAAVVGNLSTLHHCSVSLNPTASTLCDTQRCLQLVIERAAAVVGNLSTTDQFFSAIREAGAIQRLVRLLDSGSTNRTTEIAAKTLANLASESSNRKGIRLAGGVPPLMRLLMDKPSEQVRIPQVTDGLLVTFCSGLWNGWQVACFH